MKKILLIILMVALVATTAFGQAQGERPMTIKLGHIRDAEHPTHKGALLFADLVKERTNGRITVNVYPNSQLGGIDEMFAQMKTGDLEITYGGINTLAFIKGGEAFEITAIPFLYRDYEHMRKVMLSDEFKPLVEGAEKATGVKILNITGDTAPRGLSANRKITRPSDFRGLKIRTAASEVVLRVMQRLGALPQQVPLADLYVSLKTGVVDAQENGAITVANTSMYEVQKFYMKTDYIRDIETFYASPAFWNKLSSEDQKIILDATEEAGLLVTKLTNEQLSTAYEELAKHMTVVTEPELRLSEIREALEGEFNDWEGVKWPTGLLEKIKNM
jgi:tripartite ATP-independent transporter DctP family solute receptor